MNCLIVVPALIRAGAETQAVDLANGLAAKGHSIHLCCFEAQLDQRARVADEVHFHHVPRRSKYDLSLLPRLAEIMDKEEIDVVLGVMQFATLIAWLGARRSDRRPPVVAAIHTTLNRDLKDEIHDRLLYRRLLQSLPAVVFVCENQRDHWIQKYRRLKRVSHVVHNGVAPENFRCDEFAESASRLRADLGIPKEAILFACVAAFRPEKGQELLIDAFSRVEGDAYVVFAGDGDLRARVEALAAEHELTARTRFLGNIDDTRPLIAASTATVLASTAVETFSMAMLESMALGVPMIAPRIGGLPEAIIDGQTGLLFPIGDTARLAACMQSVVENPAAAAQMGQAAEQKVNEEFTRAKMVTGTEEVLQLAISSVGGDL